MLPYFSTVALPSEPDGWDAVSVLQLQNPTTGKWSCPTMTKRNRRCENVVSIERSMKITPMINEMSVQDAGVIFKDQNRELTALAEIMICPIHSRAADSSEKIKGIVAQWKNNIKTSMRTQAQPRTVRHSPRAPEIEYQPSSASTSSGTQRRHLNSLAEQTYTAPQVQTRQWSADFETSSTPQTPAPSHGATIDRAALVELMSAFQNMMRQNQDLTDQNRRLRDEHTQLVDKEKAAATERRRAEGELEDVEEERDALLGQVDELYDEINALRDREQEHLETISALQGTVQKTGKTHRNLQRVWTAASVVAKGGV